MQSCPLICSNQPVTEQHKLLKRQKVPSEYLRAVNQLQKHTFTIAIFLFTPPAVYHICSTSSQGPNNPPNTRTHTHISMRSAWLFISHCSSHGLSQFHALAPAFAALPCEPRAQTQLDKVATSCLSLFCLSSCFLFQRETFCPDPFNYCSGSFFQSPWFSVCNNEYTDSALLPKTKGTRPSFK